MKWFWLFSMVAATAAGDVLQSHQMRQERQVDGLGARGLARLLRLIVERRQLLLAMLCMALSFGSFLVLLSVSDLSFAVPASAISFAVETAAARWILKECVDARRWLGAALVIAGVALLAV